MRARDLRTMIRRDSKIVYAQEILDCVRGLQRERGGKMQVTTLDTKYRVPSWRCWKNIIDKSFADTKEYSTDMRDCDDYAFFLRGETALRWQVNSIGFVLDVSGKHAYNVIVGIDHDDDYGRLQAKFFEPQADRFVQINSTEQGYEAYSAQRGYVWF